MFLASILIKKVFHIPIFNRLPYFHYNYPVLNIASVEIIKNRYIEYLIN